MNKNTLLIIETILIFILISFASVFLHQFVTNTILKWILYVPLLLFQGLWFYRFYVVGHEASHKKLIPQNLRMNDLFGSMILLPLMVPINVYRKIHYFHHGFNRKDEHTSALDTYVVKGKFKILKKVYYYVVWYLSVFFGGFFVHSLISVLLFLFIPPAVAKKISPAFKGWSLRDQLTSIILFLLGVGLHFAVFLFLEKWCICILWDFHYFHSPGYFHYWYIFFIMILLWAMKFVSTSGQ